MAIYSNGTLVVDGANVQAPRLTGNLPALNASSLTNLDATDLSGALPAIDGSNLTGVSGSTTRGAVGTYHMLMQFSTTDKVAGNTLAGSSLHANLASSHYEWTGYENHNANYGAPRNTTHSGTWQLMNHYGTDCSSAGSGGRKGPGLWVRTS